MQRMAAVLFVLVAFTFTLLFPPAQAFAVSLNRSLSYGARGTDVRLLQDILRREGFFQQVSTGYFGNDTRRAVVAFQRAQKISPIGIVGPHTRSALLRPSVSIMPESVPPSVPPVSSSSSLTNVAATPWWALKWPVFSPGFGGGGSGVSAVVDTVAPVITGTPGNQSAEATSASGATVTYTSPSALDAIDSAPSLSCIPASGTVFPLATTTVTCTATDASHNSASVSFSVVVRDTTAPVLSSVPSTQTVEATSASGATVTYSSPIATDAADASVSVSCLPSSGSLFAIGTTLVSCAGSDDTGNSAAADFSVIVRDTTAPSVAVTAPSDAAEVSGATVAISASASDAVGVVGVQFKLDTNTAIGAEDTTAPYGVTWDSSAVSNGSHTISAVARDAAGTYATSSTVTVTIANTSYPPYQANLALFFDADQSTFSTTGSLIDSVSDLSGVGVIATSSGALRPTLVSYAGHAGMRFSNGQELMTGTNWTMDRRNSALFIVTRTQLGGTGGLNTYALTYMPQSGGTNRLAAYFNGNTFSGYDSAAKSSGFIHGHGVEVNFMSLSASSARLGVAAQEATLSAFPAGTVSGGKIGRWDGTSFPLDMTDILGVVAYNRSLSQAECNDVRDWLATHYGAVARTQTTSIIFEGDSLTYGVNSSDNITMSYPAQLSRVASSAPKIWNGGSGGDTALNNVSAAATKTILTGVSGYTNRLVVYWMGTNDISNGRTAVQIEGDIASYIAAVRAHDAGAIIFGNTIIAREPFNSTQDATIATVNEYIKNSAGFDHVIDLAADSRLSNALDTTYFGSDGIHLTDTGYGVVAALVRAAISAAGFSI